MMCGNCTAISATSLVVLIGRNHEQMTNWLATLLNVIPLCRVWKSEAMMAMTDRTAHG